MPLAGREGVGDLVQEGVAYLVFIVEKSQRPGKGDEFSLPLATAEPSAGVVKPKRPIRQSVSDHQLPCQASGEI
jgi:hypothetical protein